jgi:hypothetical protein
MSRKKKKKAKKPNKAFASSFVARAVPQVEPRQCHWVVAVKADVTAFRALYGISRNYAGTASRSIRKKWTIRALKADEQRPTLI